MGNDGSVQIMEKSNEFQGQSEKMKYARLAGEYRNSGHRNNGTMAMKYMIKHPDEFNLLYKHGGKKKWQRTIYSDTIKKPSSPYRVVSETERPSQEEIEKRRIRIRRLKSLGINVNMLDGKEEEYEGDMDKLEASILIMQDREVPEELERRIQEKNAQGNSRDKNEWMYKVFCMENL